jgi:hypothetical protein
VVRVSVPLICTQSVGALIPSAFVRAKCVASFFPFCLELFSSCIYIYIFFFFVCVCVPTSALVGYCNVEMD